MANYYNDIPQLRHYLRRQIMEQIAHLREHGFSECEKYDWAPIDKADAIDSYERVLSLIGELCAEHIAPNAYTVDRNAPTLKKGHITYSAATNSNLELLRKAGVMGLSLPRRHGGLNFPTTPFIMAAEMISAADASLQNIWGLQSCAETLYEFGTPDQHERYLSRICAGETMSMDLTEPDAGSDLQNVMLRATYDEAGGCWRLNGVKRFITNGDSDVHLVLARSEEGSRDGRGLSMFIYDRQNGGLSVRRIEHKMGVKGSPTCELVFRNAKAELCGSRRLGLIKYVMSLMNSARLGIAAQAVGISQAALKEARIYVSERRQFGTTIMHFAAVREMVDNIEAKLHASRALLYETCYYVDTYKSLGEEAKIRPLTDQEKADQKHFAKLADSLTPIAKGMGSEYANQNTYDSVQVHGGSGYMNDYTCERLYRDARVTSIYEGTTQMQVIAAVRHVTSGFYTDYIASLDKRQIRHELEPLREKLRRMTVLYGGAIERVMATESQEYHDLMARRLVEMAGSIIMGYLTLTDAEENIAMFSHSARNYIAYAEAEVIKHSQYIQNNLPRPIDTEVNIADENLALCREAIKNILPHREPMLLVDSMRREGNQVLAEYRVRGDEFFVQGHFPGLPIVPGVILCEIMGQGSSLLVAEYMHGRTPMYTGFEQVKFRRTVQPGDILHVSSRIAKKRGMYFVIEAEATVDGEPTCSGKLTIMLVETDKFSSKR